MDKINQTFKTQAKLYAKELNVLVNKIDELVGAYNNLTTVGGGSGGGSSTGDSSIEEQLRSILSGLKELQDAFKDENGVVSGIAKIKDGLGALVEYREDGVAIKTAALILALKDDLSFINLVADKVLIDADTIIRTLKTNDIEVGNGSSKFNADGSGSLANGKITWNKSGDLVVKGTFQIGANYIEYITSGISADVSIFDGDIAIDVTVTIRNENKYDLYCVVQWLADGAHENWQTSDQTDVIRVKAGSSRTLDLSKDMSDDSSYTSASHPSIDPNYSGAKILSAYRYIDRSQ